MTYLMVPLVLFLSLLAASLAAAPSSMPDTCDPTDPTTCPTSQCVYNYGGTTNQKGCCNDCCSTSSCVSNLGTSNGKDCADSTCCTCVYPIATTATCDATSSKQMGYVYVSDSTSCAADMIYSNVTCIQNGNSLNTYKICEGLWYGDRTAYGEPTVQPTFQPTQPTFQPTQPTFQPTPAPSASNTTDTLGTVEIIDHVVSSPEFSVTYIFAGLVIFFIIVGYYMDAMYGNVWVFQCDFTAANNDLVSFIKFKDDNGNVLLSIKPVRESLSLVVSAENNNNKVLHELSFNLLESKICKNIGHDNKVMPHNCNMQITVRFRWNNFIITSNAIEGNTIEFKNYGMCKSKVTNIESSVNWSGVSIKPGKRDTCLFYLYPGRDKLVMNSHSIINDRWSDEVSNLGIDFPLPENSTVNVYMGGGRQYHVSLKISTVCEVTCDYHPQSIPPKGHRNQYATIASNEESGAVNAVDAGVEMNEKQKVRSKDAKMFDNIAISKTIYPKIGLCSCFKVADFHYNIFCGVEDVTTDEESQKIAVAEEVAPVYAVATAVPVDVTDVKLASAPHFPSRNAPYYPSPSKSKPWVRQLVDAEKLFEVDEP